MMFFSIRNYPQSRWFITSSVQLTGGSYFYHEYSNLYLLYGGIRYQTENFNIYGSRPILAQNNSAFTQSGMMIIPTSTGSDGSSGRIQTHHGGDFGSMSMSNMQIDLGDFNLYGSYQFLQEYKQSVNLSINPNIKFPTATKGIGTGKFNYGVSFNLKKSIGTFSLLADAGFIKLGAPPGIDYKNPLTYGIGIGKFISENGNSILLYYNSYTEILNGYEPPRQISLGLNFKLARLSSLSLIGSKGLSNYSPDFNLSAEMNLGL